MSKSIIGRRTFLKTGAVGLALTAVSGELSAEELIVSSNDFGRQIIPLNHRWLYNEKFTPETIQPNFNDKSFAVVNIPHTNKLMPYNSFDEQDYCFVSVYRKKFILPKGIENKRVFVDFGAVMIAAKVYLNGKFVGENKGGYNHFSFELTKFLSWKGENLLAVEVDSTERKDIPPFGNLVDYLTFGGIYREVNLRIVNRTFIENVFAKPVEVLSNDRKVNVKVFLAGEKENVSLKAELLDDGKLIAEKSSDSVEFSLSNLESIKLWELDNPKLYNVRVTLSENGKVIDKYESRIGFREARFTENGFLLNGKVLKLRGLNRHQTFPWVGQAMPARVQKRDAWILKKELKTNIVRTSHYMQSPHFLDACDELGLLVLEEIPGWTHIGNEDWKAISIRDVESMITRDWNHPSLILWGVRINESPDDRDFYTKTNALARQLDDSRQTCGIRNKYDSEFLEDVFTFNEFQFPLRPPKHPRYLITETNGHMFPTKRFDSSDRIREHTHRHARFHNMIASNPQYSGGLAWCAFDYNTHDYFGSSDRICYHGVSDSFRIPKAAAGFYKSQCEPSEEIVLETAFDWSRGDENESFTKGMFCSNCEQLKIYVGEKFIGEYEPDRKTYPNLKYPPFVIDLRPATRTWGELKVEGYINGQLVKTKKVSRKGVENQFIVTADDNELMADGIDMTRVVFKVTDEFENILPYAVGVVHFSIENGEIVGDNPFALIGGCGAIWVKSTERGGKITLTAKHPRLGTKTVVIFSKK